MSSPIRAVIFDFDGVILDSNAVKTEAFGEVFARFPEHAGAMMAYHHAHVSQSRFEKFTHLVEGRLGRRGDQALVRDLAEDFAARLASRMAACPLVPGARGMLEDLAARVPLYLASVTPADELERLLDIHHLRRFFAGVYGCPPWTKPEAVRTIAAALGGPAGLVLVGDSAGDQRAAGEAGVEFVPRDSGLAFDPPVRGEPDLSVITSALRRRIAA